jgi:hydroxymethylbilane synthase
VQADLVVSALREATPDLELELIPISTSGDRSQRTNAPGPDWGTGVFVKELEAALLREDIDIAVHSLKDVPPEIPSGLTLAAIPVREDPLDVLASLAGLNLQDLPEGARVGTSSARRAAFLRALRPDLVWAPIRGNVETRLTKLADGEYDAIVLARAGLVRLDLHVAHVLLEPELLPPAPGQGALAIEARAGDRWTLDRLEPLHDPATGLAIRAERMLMTLLDGGCRLPVGALAVPHTDDVQHLHLLGGVASTDGHQVVIDRLTGDIQDPEGLAQRLAERLKHAGADTLIPLMRA